MKSINLITPNQKIWCKMIKNHFFIILIIFTTDRSDNIDSDILPGVYEQR